MDEVKIKTELERWYVCPNCNGEVKFGKYDFGRGTHVGASQYCPFCGAKWGLKQAESSQKENSLDFASMFYMFAEAIRQSTNKMPLEAALDIVDPAIITPLAENEMQSRVRDILARATVVEYVRKQLEYQKEQKE